MNDAIKQWGPLVGRILLSFIFLMSGIGKITGFAGQAAYAAKAGVPLPEVDHAWLEGENRRHHPVSVDDPGQPLHACLLERYRPDLETDRHDHVPEKRGNDGRHADGYGQWLRPEEPEERLIIP